MLFGIPFRITSQAKKEQTRGTNFDSYATVPNPVWVSIYRPGRSILRPWMFLYARLYCERGQTSRTNFESHATVPKVSLNVARQPEWAIFIASCVVLYTMSHYKPSQRSKTTRTNFDSYATVPKTVWVTDFTDEDKRAERIWRVMRRSPKLV